jgi:peroxiredoxin
MADVPERSAFLIEDGERIRSAWTLGGDLPDIDAVIAAAGKA